MTKCTDYLRSILGLNIFHTETSYLSKLFWYQSFEVGWVSDAFYFSSDKITWWSNLNTFFPLQVSLHKFVVWVLITWQRIYISFLLLEQAFVNIVLALCDPGDYVVMFAPYYFNAYMSFQMTGITNILVGPGHPKTLQPDAG